MLPSAFLYSVGTLDGNFSRLNNTLPACSPVNASSTSLRMPTHDSGSSCFRTPAERRRGCYSAYPISLVRRQNKSPLGKCGRGADANGATARDRSQPRPDEGRLWANASSPR
jgi:hypothetical protein